MTDDAKAPTMTRTQIEAEIARTRAELGATIDQLSERLSPRAQARHVLGEVQLALTQVKRKVTGEARPADEPEPTQAGWIVLGAGAVVVAVVVATVVRKL